MQTKKILVAIVILVLVIGGGALGYYTYSQNSKPVEVQETASVQTMETGEIKTEGNVQQSTIDGLKAKQFFNDCLVTSLNVGDTKNQTVIDGVKKFQAENFYTKDYAKQIQGYYTDNTSLSVKNIKPINVENTEITINGTGEKVSGYRVEYTMVLVLDGQEQIMGTEEQPLIGLVSTKDNALKLVQFAK